MAVMQENAKIKMDFARKLRPRGAGTRQIRVQHM